MGNTSATLLIQKKGRLNATARGISAALGAAVSYTHLHISGSQVQPANQQLRIDNAVI